MTLTPYTVPDIEGWMTEDEMQWLYARASTMRNVVEIGSWFGRSTHALLTACPGPVYAVDTWAGSPTELDGAHAFAVDNDPRAVFDANVGHFPNLVPLQMDSLVAAEEFEDGAIDMVFIDGDHTYEAVAADLEAWWPKARLLFCGHDLNFEAVKRAVDERGFRYKNEAGNIWSRIKP